MSIPQLTDLHAKAGDTFVLPVEYLADDDTPIDLTGYTAELSIARSAGDTNAFSYTDSDASVSIDGPNGTINIEIPRSETRLWNAGKYIYEITIVSGGGIATTLADGNLFVRPEVAV